MKTAALVLTALALAAATTEPGRTDAAPRMSKLGSASEYWDLVARFDSGHQLVSRFQVTNEGPGKHTAFAVGYVIHPDGSTTKFQNARRSHRWNLEADGWRLHIGSSQLDLRPPVRRLAIDNKKRQVKIFIDLEAETGRAVRERPDGYRVAPLDVSVRASGTIFTAGMDAPLEVNGHATLLHTWLDESETNRALRRFDFASLGGDDAILFYDLTTPDGERAHWLVIERAGEILYESADLNVSLRGVAPEGSAKRYPLPAVLEFHNSELSGHIELGRLLVARDPLGDLPQPFRMLLSFKYRPRRVWTESPFEVKLDTGSDRSTLRVRGTGISTVTFLNPLASP